VSKARRYLVSALAAWYRNHHSPKKTPLPLKKNYAARPSLVTSSRCFVYSHRIEAPGTRHAMPATEQLEQER
jgi:hypothetical protein